jgi:hypothetical protein
MRACPDAPIATVVARGIVVLHANSLEGTDDDCK